MPSYLSSQSPSNTPQSKPLPGKAQIRNAAGGYVYEIDIWSSLQRFLIIGSEGGTYYVNQAELSATNVVNVGKCLDEDGPRVVSTLVDISVGGRAVKKDPTLYVLALAASHTNDETRKAALAALPQICRTGGQLLMFHSFAKEFRGTGRAYRKALSSWYLSQKPHELAYQTIKYQNREKLSHKDLIKISHPKTEDKTLNAVLQWIVDPDKVKVKKTLQVDPEFPRIIRGYKRVHKAATAKEVADIITDYRLTREMVPTQFMKDKDVLAALLENQPMGAMVRNLASMTSNGLLTPTSIATKKVIEQLSNVEAIHRSRIHPIQVLTAMMTYKSGRSIRGTGTWTPVAQIVDALDEAFYIAFKNVPATGKSRCIALDVSGSMGMDNLMGIPGFTPRVASAAMAMVSIHTGDPYEVVAFTSESSGWRGNDTITPLALGKRQRLDDVVHTVSDLPFGSTDCALPVLWAMKNDKVFDSFEIYTDNESWAGSVHTSEALKQYRKKMGNPAVKMIAVAMTATRYSVADPADPHSIDVVGFDSSTPQMISGFIEGGF